jgi:hypothetical protein
MIRNSYILLLIGGVCLLLAAVVHHTAETGTSTFDSEMVFLGSLHNSLYYLDRAKYQWAEQNQKSEIEIPTLDDLLPYLGDQKNGVEKFIALGVRYRTTSLAVRQSDVATLTRDVRCRRGICRCYPAGSSFSLCTRWDFSKCRFAARVRWFCINTARISVPLLCALGLGSLLVFVVEHMRHRPRELSAKTGPPW